MIKTLLTILIFFAVSTYGQKNADTCYKNICKVVSDYHKSGKFNGSVIVTKGKTIVFDTVFGYKDIPNKISLDKNSLFYLGSLAKAFTATAIMILKEQKALNYEDNINKYLPNLPSFAKNITIQNLLNHTSGLPDYFSVMNDKTPNTNEDVLKWIKSLKKLDFKPGEQFQYSNTGYVFLAMIIERVSKQTFAEFLKKNIFTPLGMSHSLVFESSTKIENRAIGYNNGVLDDLVNLTTGDGGIFSTTEDLNKWAQAILERKLVSDSEWQKAFSYPKLNSGKYSIYGFGWFTMLKDNHTVVTHNGGMNGYAATIEIGLQTNIIIIALTNNGSVLPFETFVPDIRKKL